MTYFLGNWWKFVQRSSAGNRCRAGPKLIFQLDLLLRGPEWVWQICFLKIRTKRRKNETQGVGVTDFCPQNKDKHEKKGNIELTAICRTIFVKRDNIYMRKNHNKREKSLTSNWTDVQVSMHAVWCRKCNAKLALHCISIANIGLDYDLISRPLIVLENNS